MSYCRWSSMNWRCDVYVYEDVMGGWTTHVAGRRRVIPPIPDMPLLIFPTFGGKLNQVERRMDYPSRWHRFGAGIVFGFAAFWHNWVHMGTLHLIPLRPIGLPHDGESFNDSTPDECADRLEALRSLGYIVPQRAIKALREEAAAAPSGDGGAGDGNNGVPSK